MSVDQLATFAGVLLSLLMAYVPGLSDAYDKLDTTRKASVMGGLLLVVAAGTFALSCFNLVSLGIVCTQRGAVDLVWLYIQALIANQGTYLIGVKPWKSASR